MRRRAIFGGVLVAALWLAAGCGAKNRIPSGVLPREKMEGVLWDMIQADQYSSYLNKDSTHIDLKLERMRLYEQVFLLHGVSREQFRKSYDYYTAHPDLTQALFDSLQSKGSRLRSEAYSRTAATPVIVAPAPDTSHKFPVRGPVLPVMRHPAPGQGSGKRLVP